MPASLLLPMAPQAQVVTFFGLPWSRKFFSMPLSTSSGRLETARPPRKMVALSGIRAPAWAAVMIFMVLCSCKWV
ncbi:hypothetical protein D3C72_2291430 [compost metagenome]